MEVISSPRGYLTSSSSGGGILVGSPESRTLIGYSNDDVSDWVHVIILFPAGPPKVEKIDSTLSFQESEPKLLGNLRDVFHEKYDGMLFAINPSYKIYVPQKKPIFVTTGSSEGTLFVPSGLNMYTHKGPEFRQIYRAGWYSKEYYKSRFVYHHEWRGKLLMWAAIRITSQYYDEGFSRIIYPKMAVTVYYEVFPGKQGEGIYSYFEPSSEPGKWGHKSIDLYLTGDIDKELSFTFDIAYAEYKLGNVRMSDTGSGVISIPGFEFDSRRLKLPAPVVPSKLSKVSWPELAARAYQDLNYWEGNGAAYFKDLKDLSKQTESTLKSIKGITKKNRRLAALSSLYLSIHYGWKLMISDTVDLFDAIKAFQKEHRYPPRVQAFERVVFRDFTVENRLQCYYEPYAQLTSKLEEITSLLDLDLSLANAWDMIPYSFVVDWFVGIGDALSNLDRFADLFYTHKLVGYCTSQKIVRSFSAEQLGHYGLRGTVRWSAYNRKYSTRPIVPPVSPSFQLPVNDLTHYVEGSALIASRR